MADHQKVGFALGNFPTLDEIQAAHKGFAVEHALRVIQAREDLVHAWAYLGEPAALARFNGASGPLAGIPFGVKDVIDVAGMPTRCGSPANTAIAAAYGAASVELLVRAGAVPIGKTVTTEYAYRRPGPTCNPANLAHTPGGSSSGSAAAVAAGMVPFALSTQTGGSIIRPAAYCGVTGFKPSFGFPDRSGLQLTSVSLDTIGWHGISMAWIHTCARVLLPALSAPPEIALNEARVAVIDAYPDVEISDEARKVLERTVTALESCGARCVRVDVRDQLAFLARAHTVIMPYEFARNLAPLISGRESLFSEALLNNVRQGWEIPYAMYMEMCEKQQMLRNAWPDFAGDMDFILTPSVQGTAPHGLISTGTADFNKCWSVLGWPALHLPVPSDGLPLGVQLIAPWRRDFSLIDFAAQLEAYFSAEPRRSGPALHVRQQLDRN